jgi:hypothetical protein
MEMVKQPRFNPGKKPFPGCRSVYSSATTPDQPTPRKQKAALGDSRQGCGTWNDKANGQGLDTLRVIGRPGSQQFPEGNVVFMQGNSEGSWSC